MVKRYYEVDIAVWMLERCVRRRAHNSSLKAQFSSQHRPIEPKEIDLEYCSQGWHAIQAKVIVLSLLEE